MKVPQEAAAQVVAALRHPQMRRQIESASEASDPVAVLSGAAYGLLEGVNDKMRERLQPSAVPAMTLEIVDLLADLAQVGDEVKPRIVNGLLALAADGAKIQAERIDK